MRLKTVFLVVAVAAIPSWYVYRTIKDNRVPRLEWNEIFMTEDQRLREELKVANKKADEELARIAAANAPAALRREVDETVRACVQLADNLEATHNALVEEQRLLDSEAESLMRSPAGMAIAANADYVRAFREFRLQAKPEHDYSSDPIDDVRTIKQDCQAVAKKDPPPAGWAAPVYRLREFQSYYDQHLELLKKARSGVHGLVQIANKQVPDSLEAAILQQRVQEAVGSFRPRSW